MLPVLLSVFVASLLGSLHCAGMCGPLVAFCAGGEKPNSGALGAYHVARLVGYLLLGGLAGALGAAVDFGGEAAGFGRAAAVVAGLLMVMVGVSSLIGSPFARWRKKGKHGSVTSRWIQGAMGRAKELSPLARSAWIGGQSAFLPCGWLYAFAAAAAGTAHPLSGALIMLVFWAGTVPILLALGFGMSGLFGPLRKRAPALISIVLVTLGLISISGRLNVPSFAASMGPDVGARALSGELGEEKLPCCTGESAVETEGLAPLLESCGCTHFGPCVAGETCGCPGCGKDRKSD